jgi:hypothetical protein
MEPSQARVHLSKSHQDKQPNKSRYEYTVRMTHHSVELWFCVHSYDVIGSDLDLSGSEPDNPKDPK